MLLGNWSTGGVPAPKPIRIRGVTYPSQGAAAKALGVNRTCVRRAIERGTQDNIGLRTRPNLLKKGETWISTKK